MENGQSMTELPLLLRKRDTANLLVVANKDTAVRKCRMRPDNLSTTRPERRRDNLGAVDLLITIRRQSCDDQLAHIVKLKRALAQW